MTGKRYRYTGDDHRFDYDEVDLLADGLARRDIIVDRGDIARMHEYYSTVELCAGWIGIGPGYDGETVEEVVDTEIDWLLDRGILAPSEE